MRRALVLLILVALVFSLVAPAWADTTYRGKSVENLTAKSYDNKVELTWTVNVVENVGIIFGDTKVTIRRTDNPNKGWDRASVVQTIPLTEAGEVRMSWTDTGVSPGEKWYYRVSTGDVAARWKETGPITVLATPEPTPEEPGQPGKPGKPDQKPPTKDEGNTLEKMIAGVVEFPCRIMEDVGKLLGYKPLNELVFQDGLSWEERKMLPWQGNEMKYLIKWYWAIAIATAPFFIIVIAVTAFKIMFAGLSPMARKEAMESIQRWLGAVAIVALAPLMVSTLMWIVAILIDALIGAYNVVAADMGRPISDWGTISMTGEGIHTGSVLGTAFVRVFLTGIMIYLNVIYIIRKMALTAFFAFTPIMAMVWAINRNAMAATVWLSELVSNAMMPVAHGLVLCVILIFADVKEMQNGTWAQILIMLWTFVPLAETLRNSLGSFIGHLAGFNESAVAAKGMAAMAGLGGIVSISRVAGATFGGGRGGVVPPSRGGNLTPSGGGSGGSLAGGPTPAGGGVPLAGAEPAPVGGAPPVSSVTSGGGTAPTLYGPDGQPVVSGSTGGTPVPAGGPPPSGGVSRPGFSASPGYRRALRVGATVGRVAAVGMGAIAGLALAGLPGGSAMAQGLSHLAGGIYAAGSAVGYMAGSAVWRKAAPALAKVPGVEQAAAKARDFFASPGAQKVTGFVQRAGRVVGDVGQVAINSGRGVRVPEPPVIYHDGITSLDDWNHRQQYF